MSPPEQKWKTALPGAGAREGARSLCRPPLRSGLLRERAPSRVNQKMTPGITFPLLFRRRHTGQMPVSDWNRPVRTRMPGGVGPVTDYPSVTGTRFAVFYPFHHHKCTFAKTILNQFSGFSSNQCLPVGQILKADSHNRPAHFLGRKKGGLFVEDTCIPLVAMLFKWFCFGHMGCLSYSPDLGRELI
jgi:hypothetical protein